jgi:probable F420-dependent oxidoreductase
VTPRYGMSIPFPGPLDEQARHFRELAEMGYTDLWSSETSGFDAFTPLALAALTAPTARLGSAIVPAFTLGPALIAQSVAALASAAPGRVAVGIGSSSDVIVGRWNGIPFETPLARVRDVVRFLRRALTGEKITESYRTFDVRGFRLTSVPEVQPTILVAALRERMLRVAGEHSDGAILNWLSAEDVRKVAPIVREYGDGKEIVARIFVCPSEDTDLVRQKAKEFVTAYLNVPVYATFQEWLGRSSLEPMWKHWRDGDRRAALAAVPDEVVDELVVHGSPAACRAHIQRYVDAGVDTPALAVMPWGVDPAAAARLLAPGRG